MSPKTTIEIKQFYEERPQETKSKKFEQAKLFQAIWAIYLIDNLQNFNTKLFLCFREL